MLQNYISINKEGNRIIRIFRLKNSAVPSSNQVKHQAAVQLSLERHKYAEREGKQNPRSFMCEVRSLPTPWAVGTTGNPSGAGKHSTASPCRRVKRTASSRSVPTFTKGQ